jgi:hypothetical protein
LKDETTVIRKREDEGGGDGGRRRRRSPLPYLRRRGERGRGALGPAEAVALAAAALLLFAALASYFLMLRPQRTRLQAMNDERAQLQRQLRDMEASVSKDQDAQSSARTIVESLVNFESKHLGEGRTGSTRVIEELNRLIRKNSLRISGGLAFTQLQETAPGQAEQRRQRGGGQQTEARVVESVFPGVAVTLTVEGTYPRLRQFISDVEADRQSFIVINTVELEGIADSGGPPSSGAAPVVSTGEEIPGIAPGVAPRPQPAQGGARGTLVSLRLEMSAYFRRANRPAPEDQPAPETPPGPAR